MAAGSAAAYTDISASEAHAMIASDETVIVVDVREYSEFCQPALHIENAVNLPWNSGVLPARFAELSADATIVTVCASGGRSYRAAAFLDSQGFTNVHDMQGGMNGWSFDREPCGPEPVLTLSKSDSSVQVDWSPATGVQNYDLMVGFIDGLADGVTHVDLGAAGCLSVGSPFSYATDPDGLIPGTAYFYLVRQAAGSWGVSSENQERIAGSPTCD
jgi:rhodanese-related sulfurtransferase